MKYASVGQKKRYNHSQPSVAENEQVNLMWDANDLPDKLLESNRPDSTRVQKSSHE